MNIIIKSICFYSRLSKSFQMLAQDIQNSFYILKA